MKIIQQFCRFFYVSYILIKLSIFIKLRQIVDQKSKRYQGNQKDHPSQKNYQNQREQKCQKDLNTQGEQNGQNNPKNQKHTSIRIRETFETLGPIFVKFGQILSTRRDLFPNDLIEELSLLQDQVPPFCGHHAQQIIEKALGQPVETLFQQFEVQPLASASIAQVHAARLLDGPDVVVKVLRPKVEKIIERDLGLLKIVARLVSLCSKKIRHFKPLEMVLEFEKTIWKELDLTHEAASASQLHRHFENSSILLIPKVYWTFTKTNVLVMERVYGTPILNFDYLQKANIDRKLLAKRLVEIVFTQAFRDCFFHADLHPGNVWVEDSGRIITLDFGIMGTLSPRDQRYLAENLLAFMKRNYRRVAELHMESGWIPSSIRLCEFEGAIRTVCEPILARSHDIALSELLNRLFRLARSFEIDIQPQFILLQKTLFNLEGIALQLAPDLDIWETGQPILESWIKLQVGPKALLQKIKQFAPYWIDKLPEIPNLVYKLKYFKENQTNSSMVGFSSVKLSKSAFLFGMLMGIAASLIFFWARSLT